MLEAEAAGPEIDASGEGVVGWEEPGSADADVCFDGDVSMRAVFWNPVGRSAMGTKGGQSASVRVGSERQCNLRRRRSPNAFANEA